MLLSQPRLLSAGLLVLLTAGAGIFVMPATAQEAAAEPSAVSSVSLFDGKTLDGWVVLGGFAKYTIEDGAIVGTTAEGSSNTFLCTTRDYANFDLSFEVHCDTPLNSGVQIRSHLYLQDTPQPSQPSRIRQAGEVFGYQCEIAPENETSGNFWDEGRHTRWHDDFADNAEARGAFQDEKWNSYRIVAEGNHIRSWINGIACADFEDDMDASGFIGLQVHSIRKGTGPFQVRWRNLKLRELSINPGINNSFQSPDVQQFTQRFERESREAYDLREEIVASLGLKSGMTVADIGAGTGLYTRLFAKAVGDQGKVFAVDVADEFVKHVEQSCRQAGLNNVQGIVCSQTSSMLPEGSVDVVFICDTYHHFEYPYHTMRSIRNALRPNGRVVLIDFVKEQGVSSEFVMGHVRANEAQFTREVEQCGFRQVSRADFLKQNYLVTFQKAATSGASTPATSGTVRRFSDLAYRDGNSAWQLDMYMPPAAFQRPRPAIVFVHGGGWRNGDKSDGQWRSYPERFSRLGYVAVSVNYRLTDQAPFPACVEDVKCAVRWLRAHAGHLGVDPNHIGAYGNSAGAHLVSMLGLVGPEARLEGDGPYQDQSSLVQAVCASATPTDLLNWHTPIQSHRALGPLLAGPQEALGARAKRASPMTYVHQQAPPFLLVHGSQDTTVDISQADRFFQALRTAGVKDVQYMRYEDADHGVFGQHQQQTLAALEEFFANTIQHADQ